MKKSSEQFHLNLVKKFNDCFPEGSRFEFINNDGEIETFTVRSPAVVFRGRAIVPVVEYRIALNVINVIF